MVSLYTAYGLPMVKIYTANSLPTLTLYPRSTHTQLRTHAQLSTHGQSLGDSLPTVSIIVSTTHDQYVPSDDHSHVLMKVKSEQLHVLKLSYLSEPIF